MDTAPRANASGWAVLDSLTSHIAVLDRDGTIVATNAAWAGFGKANGAASAERVGVGANYLDVCRAAVGAEGAEGGKSDDATAALTGIEAVLAGTQLRFEMEYTCHGPTDHRWFRMTVAPMRGRPRRVVVRHDDVTGLVDKRDQQTNAQLQAESQYLREEIQIGHNFEEIVGNSAPLLATLDKLDQVAATDATVLLLGETGCGKELLARAIHARSERKDHPLIKVDCTTFPPGLVESELFGHVKGAFTGADAAKPGRFELAHDGTIFLDEIGELPTELQCKLLRVLQEGEFSRVGSTRVQRVDVRVIAATNRDLRAEMAAGRFRPDLYYRLSVFPVEVPPLRQRRDDIPLLASFFTTRGSKKLGKRIERISESMLDALTTYDWPGNVRELENVVERALILSKGPELVLPEPLAECGQPAASNEAASLRDEMRALERQRILTALAASGWKVKGDGNAASRLGLKPSTLRTRMKALGVERPH